MAKSKANKAWPLIRQWHVYVSVFVAPSLILFAITGALQTFRIPDRTNAPVLLQQLARVHRDDVFAVEQARPKPPESGKPAVAEKPKPKPKAKLSTEIAKWFFAATSVAIAVTTLFGLWMALAYSRRKRLMWALLTVGAVAPLVILAL